RFFFDGKAKDVNVALPSFADSAIHILHPVATFVAVVVRRFAVAQQEQEFALRPCRIEQRRSMAHSRTNPGVTRGNEPRSHPAQRLPAVVEVLEDTETHVVPRVTAETRHRDFLLDVARE